MRGLQAARATVLDLEALHKRHPTDASRVAVLWARKASNALMDQMFRYSVLEGVAGLPEGSWGKWSDNPRNAERKMADFLASNPNINPAWLGSSNTGFYQTILENIERTLQRSGLTDVTELGPEEILNNGYLGLGRFTGTRKRLLPGVGKSLASEILGGSSPRSAVGMASKWFTNMALNEIKAYRRSLDTHRIDYSGEGETGDRGIADKKVWEKNRSEWFAQLMFNPSDPLGRKIIKWVYTYLGKQKGAPYLQKWFEMSLHQKRPVKQSEVAQEFGMQPTGLGRYFPPVLGSRGRPGKLQVDFWRSDLAEELFDRFVEEGGIVREANITAPYRIQILRQVNAFFTCS